MVQDRPHKKGLEHWLKKGWTDEFISVGAFRSEVIAVDHSTQTFVLFGRIFNEDGIRLAGKDRPSCYVEETDTGVVVIFFKPLAQDVVVLYKLIDESTNGEAEEHRHATLSVLDTATAPVSRKKGKHIDTSHSSNNWGLVEEPTKEVKT